MLWVRPSSGMSTNTWNSTMNVPMESNDIKWYQIDINMNNMMYCKRNNHERNASHRRQVSASSITAICCPSESGPALPVEQLAVGSSRFGTQLMFWLASQSSPHFFWTIQWKTQELWVTILWHTLTGFPHERRMNLQYRFCWSGRSWFGDGPSECLL